MSNSTPTANTEREAVITVKAEYTQTGDSEAFAISGDEPVESFGDMLAEWPPDMVLKDVIVHNVTYTQGVDEKLIEHREHVPMDMSGINVVGDTDDTATTTTPPDGETDTGARPHRTPSQVLEDNASLYREKNADYGNSWRLVGETVGMWADELGIDSVDVSDPENAAALGLYWERLIKLVRAFNLEFSDQTPNNEATTESHADASTYAAMQAALEEGRDD